MLPGSPRPPCLLPVPFMRKWVLAPGTDVCRAKLAVKDRGAPGGVLGEGDLSPEHLRASPWGQPSAAISGVWWKSGLRSLAV